MFSSSINTRSVNSGIIFDLRYLTCITIPVYLQNDVSISINAIHKEDQRNYKAKHVQQTPVNAML